MKGPAPRDGEGGGGLGVCGCVRLCICVCLRGRGQNGLRDRPTGRGTSRQGKQSYQENRRERQGSPAGGRMAPCTLTRWALGSHRGPSTEGRTPLAQRCRPALSLSAAISLYEEPPLQGPGASLQGPRIPVSVVGCPGRKNRTKIRPTLVRGLSRESPCRNYAGNFALWWCFSMEAFRGFYLYHFIILALLGCRRTELSL